MDSQNQKIRGNVSALGWCRLVPWLMLAICRPSAAAEPIPVGLDLSIFVEVPSANSSYDRDVQKNWPKACALLKGYFGNRKERFGHGPFQTAQCIERPTTLEGAMAQGKSSWIMKVYSNEKASGFTIFYLGSGEPHSEAAIVAAPNAEFIAALTERQAVRSFTLLLQDQLPMFTLVHITPNAGKIEVDAAVLPDPMPTEYVLFTLAFDPAKKHWIARPIGFTKPTGNAEGNVNSWEVDVHEGILRKDSIVFAHNAAGRGKSSDAMENTLSALLGRFGIQSVMAGVMASFGSNLSGIRYGFPPLPATDVVSRSTMLSLFTEVRSGPVKGLRLYYDKAPQSKDVAANGDPIYFGWSSINLGWSFDLPLPKIASGIIDRFDFQPKMGVVNLDARLAGIDATGTTRTAPFTLKNAINFGAETGIEREFFDLALLRLWAGGLYSWAAIGITETKFVAMQSGLDVYWDIGKLGGIKIKGLTFLSTQYLMIGKKFSRPADNATRDVEGVITDLNFQLVFLGLGATLGW